MFVGSIHVTDEQLAAGVAAMKGEFRMSDVRSALFRAGVTECHDRAADRLLQRERKAGRIIAVNNKLWRTVAE
jgi:hypothetical protein